MDINTNNTTGSNKLLTLLFKNPHEAEQAYNSLVNQGYSKEDITIAMSDQTRDKYFSGTNFPENNLGTKATEGMGIGGAIGGTLGAIAAAVAAIGTILTIPGLGLVIAGPIAAGLAGAGAGSAVGGLIGTLVGFGVSDELAKEYEEEIKNGGVLVAVHVADDEYATLKAQIKSSNL